MTHAVPLSGVTGMAWPAIPAPAGAAMLALQWQLGQSEWLDPAAVQDAQFRQLRALAAHAVAQVPWYADALRKAGLADAWQLTPDTFRRWPVLRAAEARANGEALGALSIPKEHGRLIEARTSGSTGNPFRVFKTAASQFLSDAMVIRDHLLHGRDPSAKLGTTIGRVSRGTHPTWGLMNGVFATGPSTTIGTAEGIDAQLAWLVEEEPAYVIAHAGNLRALLVRSRETGRAPKGVRQLIAEGGTLPVDLRDLARRLWNVEVADTYSCEEFGLLASQCPGHEHYHVHAEHVLVEVVREDDTPCEPGETGRVLVTSLQNFAMPLIRYEQGDYAEAGARCQAGRGLPVLNRIVGRSRNMLRTPDGRRIFPAIAIDLWLEIAPIRQYRVVQSALSTIELHYAMDRELTAYERSALKAKLSERLGYPFDYAFVRVDEFERAPGGKFEDFVSRLEGDA